MKWFVDMFERAVATYVEAFLGLLLVNWQSNVVDLSTFQSAAIAAVPAGLAVIKAGLARFVGNPDTASVADPGL